MHGTMPLAPTLDTIGLLGRSARDIAPAAMALAGLQQPAAAPPRTAAVLADVIAATEAPVARAVRNGIAAIEAVGVTLTQRGGQGAIETSDEPVFAILQAEAARAHGDTLRSGAVRSELAQRLRKGLDIDERPYLAGRAAAISAFLETVFADADVLLLPVMPIRTPPAKACDPTASAFHPRTLYALSRWTRFVNFLGFPSVAVPVGFDDRDMPVALQIVGKPGRDMELIVVAAAMQSKTDWHARVPPGVADLAASMLPDEVI
jgi:aspartyl-tRNA(Asn)/glutamyl-tRNA(Gln) amidotransferase subunit A